MLLEFKCAVSKAFHISSAHACISRLPSGVHILCTCIITCTAIIVLIYKLWKQSKIYHSWQLIFPNSFWADRHVYIILVSCHNVQKDILCENEVKTNWLSALSTCSWHDPQVEYATVWTLLPLWARVALVMLQFKTNKANFSSFGVIES